MPRAYHVPSSRRWPAVPPEHTHPWYEYADRWLNFPLGRVLDFGCGSGGMLRRIADRSEACFGVDVDPVRLANARRLTRADVRPIVPGRPLPFDDAQFDTVLLVEVIEHVPDERTVLAELSRVLRPGGRLLVTTPHRGPLTFLDPGNFKFLLPGLHRFIHRRVLGQPRYYEQQFGDARRAETGLLGDFSAGTDSWHRHYPFRRLRALVPAELRTVAWRAYFPGLRALWSLRLALRVVSRGRVERLPEPLAAVFRGLSRCESRWGDQLVALFGKRG